VLHASNSIAGDCVLRRHAAAGARAILATSVPNFSHLGLFVGAALALLAMPGPAVLYIVTRSVAQGRLVGLVSVLGICTGTLVHVAAAAVGLSALLVSSARAFNVVRVAGAVYLIALGVQVLAGRNALSRKVVLRAGDLRRVYVQGVIVNLFNPHTALFFFAFLPQFVDPARGHVPLQMTTLGLVFVGLSMVTDAIWAIAAGTAGGWINRNPRFARGQRYVTGGALIGLGAATAFSGSGKK
jgi:threonine/homoserine/homoserine lactone efflux protein